MALLSKVDEMVHQNVMILVPGAGYDPPRVTCFQILDLTWANINTTGNSNILLGILRHCY